ncbi:carboxymuconolactone decarboxylase family protein [Actinomycetospora straminea]|uniref:Carboxymuconolactone decarboxylase family protein n=1 Tax=Actinomycetospora straminea TaxID=663607 RepID=A0ABP9EJZ0_9PSEU|nr:carboxymuconolactone decarboxylase family protein [Actinomycetospora straminea]MDD7933776.1 carboxymuconolactone decarboxylase family protein [Actinomycetospora straminea]
MDEDATAPAPDDRYARGLEILRVVGGQHDPAVVDALADLAPDLARYTVEFAYGDVYARPGLTWRERQLVTVAALTALGTAPTQLHFHIRGALEVGTTPREITETIAHISVYAGFPAALNGLSAARAVFSEEGAAVEVAADRGPDGDESRYERGLRLLSEIDGDAGHRVVESLRDVAPDLGRYLVEFAFGDIYAGTGLDLRMRELVTVAACTALGTATPQLRLHVGGCLNVGGTREDVVEVITQMAVYAGFPAALNALAAAREAFASH